jgi:hypothetical protein
MATVGKDYFNRLENFYKILTPVDLYGKTKQVDSKMLATIEKDIYENYLVGVYSGDEIINNLKGLNAKGKGIYFNTMFQEANGGQTKYLEPKYWESMKVGNITGTATTYSPPANFFDEVCRGKGPVNPVDFSINVLRSAYFGADPKFGGRAILPMALRNSDAVELFLNAMPTIFPSMMVPYFEVEFDFPIKLPAQTKNESRDQDANFLNRPSLLRFLLGSVDVRNMPLSEADKSLIATKKILSRAGKPEDAYNVGMELFTSPQTLTNYNTLRANGKTRIRDAKPFLPPATLTGGSLTLVNAGSNAFVNMKASLQFTIHDKARVSEFSEFFRIVQGTHDVTVWLTYGWLAPRTQTDTDAYSKFINETMLRKVAFNIMNLSFSFDAYGQANVSLELVQQGKDFVDSVQLTHRDSSDLFKKLDDVVKNMDDIEQAKSAVNDLEGPVAAFKIVADVKTALGQGEAASLSAEDLKKVDETIKQLQQDQNKMKLDKELYDKLLDGLQSIKEIADLYDKKKNVLRGISRGYASEKFKLCTDPESPDPFLPEEFKKEITIGNDTFTVFKQELLNEITAIQKPPKVVQTKDPKKQKTTTHGTRRIASFGKVFSTFCLPPLLDMAKRKRIEEVQVNFYQLNENCGPLSLHNVAEFPIDMDMLIEQFAIESEKVGGEMMTLSRFLRFVNDAYIRENRAIGYGMTSFYEGYTREKPEEKPKQGSQSVDFEKKMKTWSDTYGILRQPSLQVRLETTPKRTVSSKIDLLEQLRNPDQDNSAKIMKIHIYDAHLNPYDNVKQRILKNSAGSYVGVPEEYIKNDLVDLAQYDSAKKSATVGDVTIIGASDNPLVEHVEHVMPTLHVGANSSLISSISVSSKMDAQLGTALAVPTQKNFRATNTLSPNGLSTYNTDLPIRLTNASISMTSLGCPIAELYQHFYVDFGTGTTMDNIYAATALSHTFGPGKFETSWTFVPTDGYPTFMGANTIKEAIKNKTQTAQQKAAATNPKGNSK